MARRLVQRIDSGRTLGAAALGDDGTIYVADDRETFFAVGRSGNTLWTSAPDGGVLGSAVVGADNTIYFVDGELGLRAIARGSAEMADQGRRCRALRRQPWPMTALSTRGGTTGILRDSARWKLEVDAA